MTIKEILETKKKSENVQITAVIINSEIRKTKNGNGYLSLDISDGKNIISCKSWSISEIGEFNSEMVIDIIGTLDEFNGIKSILISELKINNNIPLEDFVDFDFEANKESLTKIINFLEENTTESQIKSATKHLLKKYENEFLKSVAAVRHHHSELGGLLKHSREVLGFCKSIQPISEHLYNVRINKNLLLCGAILHDIGKIHAYTTGFTNGVMSTEGKLLDHITLSTLIINEAYTDLNLDKDSEYMSLLHIIVSHHMHKEWGSMVEPKSIEAYIVHFADNLSANLSVITNSISESNSDSQWVKNIYSNGEFFKTIQ